MTEEHVELLTFQMNKGTSALIGSLIGLAVDTLLERGKYPPEELEVLRSESNMRLTGAILRQLAAFLRDEDLGAATIYSKGDRFFRIEDLP